MMALTATATPPVINDIIKALHMNNVMKFIRSFNRAELKYEVRKKGSFNKTIDEIAAFILKYHPESSGIVYCMSRKLCEDVTVALNKKFNGTKLNNKVVCYHAGIEDYDERQRVQIRWSSDKAKVIVATTAFGMGINKPDVRYVIHYSLPQSLIHYYQESGRAGRDQQSANCILYYNYSDKLSLINLIQQNADHSRDTYNINNVNAIIKYCESQTECRRSLILQYFGENYNSDNCNETCDNCKRKKNVVIKDVKKDACNLCKIVEKCQNKSLTIIQCVNVYKGSKTKSQFDSLPQYLYYNIY